MVHGNWLYGRSKITYVDDNPFSETFRGAGNSDTTSSTPTSLKIIFSRFNPFNTISCHEHDSVVVVICYINGKIRTLVFDA